MLSSVKRKRFFDVNLNSRDRGAGLKSSSCSIPSERGTRMKGSLAEIVALSLARSVGRR